MTVAHESGIDRLAITLMTALFIWSLSPCFAAETMLSDDFRPVVGKGEPMPVGEYRLLIAESSDGLSWTRTNLVLADRSSVSDAIVLSSGRIIIYYVTVGKVVNGVTMMANDIVAAVSDDNGYTWTYKSITFSNEPSGATKPVDPNVMLMPDGSLSMLVTIDPDQGGSAKPQTYRAVSTDGGFSYAIQGKVFSVTDGDVLDPENYRFSESNWRLYSGGIPGKTRCALSTDNGSSFSDQGTFTTMTDDGGTNSFIVADVTPVSESLFRIYMFGQIGSADGIRSMYSTDGLSWTVDSGNRLTIDTSTGVESSRVWAPTVIKNPDGKYLMVYETIIPSTASSTIQSVVITTTDAALKKGETLGAVLRSVYTDTTLRDITRIATWSSSNQSVATVSSIGVITALSAGTTVITATYGSNTDTMTVTVTAEYTAPRITTASLVSATQDALYSETVVAVDDDASDTVSFILSDGPQWLSLDSSGILSGTPANGDVGNGFAVIIIAKDTHGLADTLSTMIDVINVMEPPSNAVVADVQNDNGHKLNLTWDASPDEAIGYVDVYRIYRSRKGTLTVPLPLTMFATLDSLIYYEARYTVLIDSVAAGVHEFLDAGVPLNGVSYYYWVEAAGPSGASEKIATGTATTVEKRLDIMNPSVFELFAPHPNPFNPSTFIEWYMPAAGTVSVKIYNVAGQCVAILAVEMFEAGRHAIVWNAESLPSGVYFCSVASRYGVHTAKALLMK